MPIDKGSMRKCRFALDDRRNLPALVCAIRACLLASLVAIGSGCATTTREMAPTTRTEKGTPIVQCKAARVLSVVSQSRAGEAGLLVTCTGVFESVCSQSDIIQWRAETTRRTADPVDWNTIHTPFAWTSAYVADGRSFNWSRKLGAFSQTKKFSWADALAPSRNVGFFPMGTDYRNWWLDWSYAAKSGGMASPALPYTLSSTWIIDAFWTATWPLAMMAVSPNHTDEVLGAPFMLPIGFACDVVCFGVDGTLMIGAIPFDLANLLVLDTTAPFVFDTVTMTGVGLGDSSCLLGVTAADAVWSAVTAVPNVLVGLADAVYPAAQATNTVVTGESKGEPRLVTTRAPPDFTGMHITLSTGTSLQDASVDANGTAWISTAGPLPGAESQIAEILLWDGSYRVRGTPIQLRLPRKR